MADHATARQSLRAVVQHFPFGVYPYTVAGANVLEVLPGGGAG